MSTKPKTTAYALRITNGVRTMAVVMDATEPPDMLQLYREFCMTTDIEYSDHLHSDFAYWLINYKQCEGCRIKDFTVYNPEQVRRRVV